MPLTKSKGNMYEWVTHTHTHLGGECPNHCTYCFVESPRWGRALRYTGDLRLIEPEFSVRYGEGKTIFVEHCNDIGSEGVCYAWRQRIYEHCNLWPKNTYVFQSKNPLVFFAGGYPHGSILGTTIETNREIPTVSKAPAPASRYLAMKRIEGRKFVTIEPILDFDVDVLVEWIVDLNPEFLNIGADSKGHGLIEPPKEKVIALIEKLGAAGVKINEKHNLARLLK